MKVLWITNCEPSIMSKHFGCIHCSGGWIDYSHELLAQSGDIDLYVLSCGNDYEWIEYNGIKYAGFLDYKKFDSKFEKSLDYVKPDIVHIWGTEYEHFLQTVDIMEKRGQIDKLLVSIQGLVSVIDQYYCFSLPEKICRRKTLYEYLRHASIEDSHRSIHNRGVREIQGLKAALNCIGRTDWDKAITRQYNPKLQYFKCNEILRKNFYDESWEYDSCEKHTVVFSQSGYILKGFHVLIEAIEIVKKFFPDVKVYAIGKNPFEYDGVKDWIKRDSYNNYLAEMIKKKKLQESIEFVGFLDEKQMVSHYKRGNVFVCASGIENSSNSVGEAMMLGMPIVASDVGGIKSFIRHNDNGIIYQSDSRNMLADGIIRMFENNKMAIQMGQNAHELAKRIYDPQINTQTMLDIYEKLYI